MNVNYKDILIGRNKEGEKFFLSVHFRENHRKATNTEHQEIDYYESVGFSGVLTTKYGSISTERGWISAGQNYEYLLEITEPAKGFTIKSIKEIYSMWREYHLNDMKSHCAHQDESVKWDIVERCEVGNYKAGSAWLVEPLPKQVQERILSLITKTSEKVSA
jgi:hypothetical protein